MHKYTWQYNILYLNMQADFGKDIHFFPLIPLKYPEKRVKLFVIVKKNMISYNKWQLGKAAKRISSIGKMSWQPQNS